MQCSLSLIVVLVVLNTLDDILDMHIYCHPHQQLYVMMVLMYSRKYDTMCVNLKDTVRPLELILDLRYRKHLNKSDILPMLQDDY